MPRRAGDSPPYQPHPRRFFHWELEFPDVFFAADGSHKNQPGFDAVIGNPPYVSVTNIDAETRYAILQLYLTATGRFDLYIAFTERALALLRPFGRMCFIEPIKFAIYANGKARPLYERAVTESDSSGVLAFVDGQLRASLNIS